MGLFKSNRTTAEICVNSQGREQLAYGRVTGAGSNDGVDEVISKVRRMAGLTESQAEELALDGELAFDSWGNVIEISMFVGIVGPPAIEGWE